MKKLCWAAIVAWLAVIVLGFCGNAFADQWACDQKFGGENVCVKVQ